MIEQQCPILHPCLSIELLTELFCTRTCRKVIWRLVTSWLCDTMRRQQFVTRMNVQIDHINVSSLQEGKADLVQFGASKQMLEQLHMCLVALLA